MFFVDFLVNSQQIGTSKLELENYCIPQYSTGDSKIVLAKFHEIRWEIDREIGEKHDLQINVTLAVWVCWHVRSKMEDGLHLHRDATDLSRENMLGADPYDHHFNRFTTGVPNIYFLCPLESQENFTNMTMYAFTSRWFIGKPLPNIS